MSNTTPDCQTARSKDIAQTDTRNECPRNLEVVRRHPESPFLPEDLYILPVPIYRSPRLPNEEEMKRIKILERLQFFLTTAPTQWSGEISKTEASMVKFPLPRGEQVSCVLWNGLFHITGTDIVRALSFRFDAFSRPIKRSRKWEEGVFSDLRNLKAGVDATLEEPKSPLLDYLFRNGCIRTQKKQKVFYWFSVPHDRLFLDALERDLKREKAGREPTSVIQGEPARSFRYDPRKALYEQFGSETEKVASTVNNVSRLIDPGQPHYDVPIILDECSDARSHHFAPPFKGRNHMLLACNKSISQASRHLVGTADEPSECGVRSKGSESSYLRPTYFNTAPDPTLPTDSYLNSSTHLLATAARVHIPSLGSPDDREKCSSLLPSPTHERPQNNVRVFNCPYDFCKRPFKRFEHLRRHVRCHTDDRPFTCDICHRTFTRRDNLAQHAKTHNKSRNHTEMQHQCQFQPNRSISIPVGHDLFTTGRGLGERIEGNVAIETKSPALSRAITAPPVWVGAIPPLPTEDSPIPPILTTGPSSTFFPMPTTHSLPLLGSHVPHLRSIAEDRNSSFILGPCKSPVLLHPLISLHDDKETLQKHAANMSWPINDTDVL
uniref:STE12 n=2 Tax=Cryptococcus neoformans species complex TaxID=1897064 RepID=Q8J0X6_9TREE|nr:STE12a [Cryptococcus neoformans var. neoformans]AAN75614.1 STE12 [Cryptococcus neoformans var. neoformans]